MCGWKANVQKSMNMTDLGKQEQYNKVKVVKKRPFHANQACINDKNSNTVTYPDKVLERWHEYGTNLFGKPDNERLLSIHNPEEKEPPPPLDEVGAQSSKGG